MPHICKCTQSPIKYLDFNCTNPDSLTLIAPLPIRTITTLQALSVAKRSLFGHIWYEQEESKIQDSIEESVPEETARRSQIISLSLLNSSLAALTESVEPLKILFQQLAKFSLVTLLITVIALRIPS